MVHVVRRGAGDLATAGWYLEVWVEGVLGEQQPGGQSRATTYGLDLSKGSGYVRASGDLGSHRPSAG